MVDYISIPPPRTTRLCQLVGKIVRGHGLKGSPEEMLAKAKAEPAFWLEDCEHIDWWGDRLSFRAKTLRYHDPCTAEVRRNPRRKTTTISTGTNWHFKLRDPRKIVFEAPKSQTTDDLVPCNDSVKEVLKRNKSLDLSLIGKVSPRFSPSDSTPTRKTDGSVVSRSKSTDQSSPAERPRMTRTNTK